MPFSHNFQHPIDGGTVWQTSTQPKADTYVNICQPGLSSDVREKNDYKRIVSLVLTYNPTSDGR